VGLAQCGRRGRCRESAFLLCRAPLGGPLLTPARSRSTMQRADTTPPRARRLRTSCLPALRLQQLMRRRHRPTRPSRTSSLTWPRLSLPHRPTSASRRTHRRRHLPPRKRTMAAASVSSSSKPRMRPVSSSRCSGLRSVASFRHVCSHRPRSCPWSPFSIDLSPTSISLLLPPHPATPVCQSCNRQQPCLSA
jgi:hypothetical protein